MSAFIYFRKQPKSAAVTPQLLEEWGIGYLTKQPISGREVVMPNVGKGITFSLLRTDTSHVRMDMDKQVWRQVPGHPDTYVGYWKDNPPTEEKLRREERLNGYLVKLRDGVEWSVPSVVLVEEGEIIKDLPCYLDVDEKGNPIDGEVIDVYRYLWDLAKPYMEKFLVPVLEKKEEDIPEAKLLRDAVQLLSVNYHIGLTEVLLLNLFTRDVWGTPLTICLCAIDYSNWSTWVEATNKKKCLEASDGSNTSAGQKDDIPATEQPLQT